MNVRIVTFYHLAQAFANRFERLAPDADGIIDRTDKQLKRKFLAELERIAAHFEECRHVPAPKLQIKRRNHG